MRVARIVFFRYSSVPKEINNENPLAILISSCNSDMDLGLALPLERPGE